jgi:hypothetical protein
VQNAAKQNERIRQALNDPWGKERERLMQEHIKNNTRGF